MAKFTIHKVTSGFSYTGVGTNDGVYFEEATAAAALTATGLTAPNEWMFLRVTDDSTSPIQFRNLAVISLPGDNSNHEKSGVHFSDLSTNWAAQNSGGPGQIVMRTNGGTYDGSDGFGRSVALDDTFDIAYNATLGAYVLSAVGTATGIVSFDGGLYDTAAQATFDIAINNAGYGNTFTGLGDGDIFSIKAADQTTKHSWLAPANNTPGQPLWRNIRAGDPETESTITVAERGDVIFEGDTWTEGATTRWFGLMADLETGVDKFGKQVEFDQGVFTFTTTTPTGSTTTWDQLTLNLAGLGWTVGDGVDTDFISLNTDQLDFTTTTGSTGTGNVLYFDIVDAGTATPEMTLKAIDPGADSFVWYKNTTTEVGLTYGTFGTGLNFDPATGILTATGTSANNGTLDLSISVTPGTSGQAIEIGTGTGFSANTASNYDYEIEIGPAISDYANQLRAGGIADNSIIYKDAVDSIVGVTIGTGLSFAGGTLSSTVAAPNDGNLALTVTAGATNTAVTLGLGTGYSADTASNVTYDINVGPAITNLAGVMTGVGSGFVKKTAQDTYTIDTTTYLTSWGFNIDANNGTSDAIADGNTILFVGNDPIDTTVTNNQIAIDLLYNTNDFEIGAGGVLQLKDKFVSDWKESVRVATNSGDGTVTISSNVVAQIAGTTIDGINVDVGDRILIKNAPAATGAMGASETTQPANGIYEVESVGANIVVNRSADADTSAEVTTGLTTTVSEGSQADTIYQLITNDDITLDTTPLLFTAVAKTAFFGVGWGMILDTSGNEVTFAEPNTSTPINQSSNSTHHGITYYANSIEVAVDDETIEVATDDQIQTRWATLGW